MRIAVVVEHGWDPASVEVDPLSGVVDETRTVAGIGDPSRSAVALALRLRGADGRVEVLTAAPAAADDELRGLLAVGVDAVARVWADGLEGAGPEASARALAGPLGAVSAELVLVADRGLDGGRGQLGPMLAELLGLPQATAVEQLAITASGGEVTVRRRLDRGAREQLALFLPAVVCVEPGIAVLAEATLPALLAAREAPVPLLAAAAEVAAGCRLVRRVPPRPRPRRIAGPDPALPVEARLAAVLGGGERRDHDHTLVEGPPEVLVDRVVRLLEERGYLGSSPPG
jgi:electron transfer flavoprotein beta subunit